MPVSALFFPLRTSVELFDDRTSPAAVTRAKEAAVLYDELIFEAGIYDIKISPTGSFNSWTPPEHATPERLQDTRRVIPLGEPIQLAVGVQPSRGVPATEMRVVVQGDLSAHYIAEFHTGIIDELAPLDQDWIKTVVVGGSDNPAPSGTPPNEAIRRLNFADLGAEDLMPAADTFLKGLCLQVIQS